jgi:hypothetical protein
MGFRNAGFLALGLLLIGGVVFAAEEGVKVSGFTGKGVVQGSDMAVSELVRGSTLSQGDIVSIATGAMMTLEFADGSVAAIVGPARFGLDLVADYARTIQLYEGTITRLEVKEVTTGIVTPGGAFVAAQNGAVFARAEPGASGQMRTTFKLIHGSAKSGIRGGDVQVMNMNSPVVFDMEVPGAAPSPRGTPPARGDGKAIQLGLHEITYYPSGGVTVETTADGGRTFTSTVPEGDYAMVIVDDDTTLYLGRGEAAFLSGDGFIVRSEGVVHIYAPLSITAFWYDPVRDPAGSSFTGNAIK